MFKRVRVRTLALPVIGALVAATAVVMTTGTASAASSWKAVDAGSSFTCGIKQDGSLWCWGKNDKGQLGQGSTGASVRKPKQVGSARNWASVTLGLAHACALNTDGYRSCWGANDRGQLGLGHENAALSPTPREGEGPLRQISAGGYHTCAIGKTSLNRLYCWGADESGQVGDGPTDTTDQLTIYRVAEDIHSVATGFKHTCAIDSEQTRWCWGIGTSGALGLSNDETNKHSPARNGTNDGKWAMLSLGKHAGCGIKSNTLLFCWGANDFGQAGYGVVGQSPPGPVNVLRQYMWSWVGEGDMSVCGTSPEGSRYCWGSNSRGQLGISGGDQSAPTPPDAEKGVWAMIVSGKDHACGIKDTGALYCWGDNQSGELGIESSDAQRFLPTKVNG